MRAVTMLLVTACFAPGCSRTEGTNTAQKQEVAAQAEPQPAPGQPAATPDQGAANKVEPAQPGDTVPAFELTGLDLSSKQPADVSLSSTDRDQPTAYVFVGTTCKTTAKYLGRIAELEKSYGDKVDFAYVYPNKTDSPEAIQAFHKEHGLSGPLFVDQGAKVAALLGRKRTAEVVVVGKDNTIVYTGAIDDNKDESAVTRKHLAIALDEHLAGKPVSHPKTIGTA